MIAPSFSMIKPILYPGENNESDLLSLFSLRFADGSAIRFWNFVYIYLISDWNIIWNSWNRELDGWVGYQGFCLIRVSDLGQEESDFDFDFGCVEHFFHCFLYFWFIEWRLRLLEE